MNELTTTKDWKRLDEFRKKAIVGRVWAWVIWLIAIMGGIYWITDTDSESDFVIEGLLSIPLAFYLLFLLWRMAFKNYSKHYKALIVPKLVANVITRSIMEKDTTNKNRCQFWHDRHINVDRLLEVPMFKKFKKDAFCFYGEDLFSGAIGQTDFQFSDFEIKKKYASWFISHEFELTKFRGLVFFADFHKSFEGTTTLRTRKGKLYRRFAMTGKSMNTISHEFNKMFKITAVDELTARYLLPVNMLERLINLRKRFAGKGMTICLHNGMLVIAIHNVDFFEADGLKKLEINAMHRTDKEIQAVLELIDLLNLNTRIWSKQEKDFSSAGR